MNKPGKLEIISGIVIIESDKIIYQYKEEYIYADDRIILSPNSHANLSEDGILIKELKSNNYHIIYKIMICNEN